MTSIAIPNSERSNIRNAVEAACAKIAPAWPLDRMIAVNPYWGWTGRPVQEAAAELGALSGAPFLMPRTWYRQQQESGAIPNEAIERALVRGASHKSVQDVLTEMASEAATLPRHPVISDIRDELRDPLREATWQDHILQQVGLSCAAYFDRSQATWQADATQGFYAFWRSLAAADTSPQLLLGDRLVRAAIAELPDTPEELFTEAVETLALPRSAQEQYLTALLMRIGGWASHAAFKRWEARLQGSDDANIEEILAVRLAWELALYRSAEGTDLPTRWTRARRDWQVKAAEVAATQSADWVMQRAFEARYQDKLAAALVWHPSLRHADTGSKAPATVSAQAVFCIDVRSEILRRHLEEASGGVHTLGFAGFFGLPIAYESLSGERRPQLPGLLAASLTASDDEPEMGAARASVQQRRDAEQQWRRVASSAPGTYPVVETTGLASALKLAMASFEPTRPSGDPMRDGRDNPAFGVAPSTLRTADGQALSDEARVDLALGILRGMSLVAGFAPLVALVGHGSLVTNNPQAAGLACGACGGQSGEVNARVAAALINDPNVRKGLRAAGVEIPLGTRFIAAVHDTTTDDVLFFPDTQTEASHADELAELKAAFARASRRVRLERAARLGPVPKEPNALADALRHRAADWSEIRPEWALAGNAAFIAAPRTRSRALELKGRAFLHEYDCRLDASGAVLETILTAPVVVAHWINFQYWGSTVDPMHFGSGDKTRHNVVGGTLGVVEGAGGDLRIGLAQQSVHDGKTFVHEPMRLAVYVEATAESIDAIIARQPTVRQLVEGEWLFLYRIDPNDAGAFLRSRNGWEPVSVGAASRW